MADRDYLFDRIRDAGKAIMDGKQVPATIALPVDSPLEKLPADPEALLFDLLQEAGQRVVEQKLEKLAELGLADLSVNMVHYIDVIGSLENPNATQIAEALELAKPSVTAILRKLEGRGIIRKQVDSRDMRAVRIVLTPEGNEAIQAFREVHRTFTQQFQDRLDAEGYRLLVELLAIGMGRTAPGSA